jgi:hypothetical protein
MLRRLIFGLVLGLIVGVGLAAGLIRLGEASFAAGTGVLVAYLAAGLAGSVTGMIAGKPIWASGAKIEGGLKAAFGALIGIGAMFALRQWATGFDVNLSFVGGGGPAPVGELPAASLPLIAAVLGGLFGLDNTDTGGEANGASRKRVAAGGARIGPGAAKSQPEVEDDGEGASVAPRRAKR